MTQKVKVKTNGNQDLGLVLRDDGRIFYEDLTISIQSVEKEKKNLTPYLLFAVAQVQIIILVVLNILEVI